MLNYSLKEFTKNCKRNKNQVLYLKLKAKNDQQVLNLIDNFLIEENSFIFESVEKGKIKGRYTIFGKRPDKIWEFNKNQSFFYKKGKKVKISGLPKENIEKIIEDFKFDIPKELPNISSILSGYFSYDIIRYIENIPNNCLDDLNLPDARLIRPKILVIHDNLMKQIYFIYNCFSDHKIDNYKNKYNEIKAELEYNLYLSTILNQSNNKKIKKIKKIKSNISKMNFLNNVKKAQQHIKIGDIFQVVLSQRFETELTKSPLEIYKKLRVTNPSPFMYFFNFKDFKIIGASPEILVRLRNNNITIRPIAGTRPRGKNKKQDEFYKKDLLNDQKENSEHLMLLDLGRNDTGKVSKIGTVKVTEKFTIEKYSHVMHIVSNVVGKFNNKYSNFETFLAGFPAGTVSGAPKIRAMEIIDNLEKSQRKIYAGGIGYFSANGDFDTCIALRTAIAKNNKLYVQAGAGIVADSKPLNEFKETENKAKALINALR